jgi:hypothetical protein
VIISFCIAFQTLAKSSWRYKAEFTSLIDLQRHRQVFFDGLDDPGNRDVRILKLLVQFWD